MSDDTEDLDKLVSQALAIEAEEARPRRGGWLHRPRPDASHYAAQSHLR
jgi:hypothetical protein